MASRHEIRWPRLLAAGAAAGFLVGFLCGLFLVVRNPVGGAFAELTLLLVTALGYALLLALPIALVLAIGFALSNLLPEKFRVRFGDFGGLVGVGLAAAGLAVGARRLVGAWLVREDLGLAVVLEASLKAAAITLGFAVVASLTCLAWRFGEGRFGVLGTAALGTLGLIAASFPAVLVPSPSMPRGAAEVVRTATTSSIAANSPRRRVALIGFDGLDPLILGPLIADGEMPHLAELARDGLFSELDPLGLGLSPPIWATISTGVDPSRHGIHDFVSRPLRLAGLDLAAIKKVPRGFGFITFVSLLSRAGLTHEDLVTPFDRHAPAIWTISSLASLDTFVVDWMTTWPSESITGTMVSDRAFFLANLGSSGDLPVRSDGEMPIRLLYHGPESETSGLCSPEPDCLSLFPPAGTKRLDPARQMIDFHVAEDAFYREVAQRLLTQSDCQLLMFYSHLPDFLNHQFSPEELEQVRRGRYDSPTGGLTREIYREVDRTLGSLLDHLGKEFSVLIVSDHGVEIVEIGDARSVSHAGGPPGVFFFRPSMGSQLPKLETRPSIFDIAPTVLALLGLPLTSQMQGRVLSEVIEAEFGPGRSFHVVDAGEVVAANAAARAIMSPEAEEEIRERLRSLGYVN